MKAKLVKRTSTIDRSVLVQALNKPAAAILKEMGVLVDGGLIELDNNPVWLGLSAMEEMTDKDFEAMADDKTSGLTQKEIDRFKRAYQAGAPFAKILRRHIWRGGQPNKSGVMQAYLVCQIIYYDRAGGPERDQTLGQMRQQWYDAKTWNAMGFKYAAQALEHYLAVTADFVAVGLPEQMEKAIRLGVERQKLVYKSDWSKARAKEWKEEHDAEPRVATIGNQGWGRMYSQQESALLVGIVEEGTSFEDIYVADYTTGTDVMGAQLLNDFHGLVVMEKKSVAAQLGHFAQALGVDAVIGTGGNAPAAYIETIIRELYKGRNSWDPDWAVSRWNPLHVFIIVDWDAFGHIPIMGSIEKWVARTLPAGAVKFWHIGIWPSQLRAMGRSMRDAGLEIESYEKNRMVQEWADLHAAWYSGIPYGVELDAISTSTYAKYVARAIWGIVGGKEKFIEAWEDNATPSPWEQGQKHRTFVVDQSLVLKRMGALNSWLANVRYNQIEPVVGNFIKDMIKRIRRYWKEELDQEVEEYLDEILTSQEFVEYVLSGMNEPWNPVDNERICDWVQEKMDEQWPRSTEGTIPIDTYANRHDVAKWDELYPQAHDDYRTNPMSRAWPLVDLALKADEQVNAETDDGEIVRLVDVLEEVFDLLEPFGLEMPDENGS